MVSVPYIQSQSAATLGVVPKSGASRRAVVLEVHPSRQVTGLSGTNCAPQLATAFLDAVHAGTMNGHPGTE